MKKIIGKLAAVLAVGLSLVFASCSTGVVDNGTAPEITDAFFASQVHSDGTVSSTKENYRIYTMSLSGTYKLLCQFHDPDKDIREIWMSRSSDFSGAAVYWVTEENQQSAYYNTANTLNWSASTISSDTRNSFIGTGAIYLQVKDSKGNVGTFTIPGITITNN